MLSHPDAVRGDLLGGVVSARSNFTALQLGLTSKMERMVPGLDLEFAYQAYPGISTPSLDEVNTHPASLANLIPLFPNTYDCHSRLHVCLPAR
jgi:hypothetical protein